MASKLYRESAAELARNWLRRNGMLVAFVLLMLGVWRFITLYLNPGGNIYFPSLPYVFRQSVQSADAIYSGIGYTLFVIIGGFILSFLSAIAIAMIMAEIKAVRDSYLPIIVLNFSSPQIVWAPLFVMWFGPDVWTIILWTGFNGFYVIFVNVFMGLVQYDRQYDQLAEILGTTRWQFLWKFKIWLALPNIVSGVKLGIKSAISGAIAAEFVAGSTGIGYLILRSSQNLRVGTMFGGVFIMTIVAIVLYRILTNIIDYILPRGLEGVGSV